MPPDDHWPEDSRNPWRDDEGDRFGPEAGGPAGPPPGMSGAKKVLIVLLVLVGGMFVLCCGGVIYLASQFRLEQSPQEALRATKEIVEIEVPEAFQPFGVMRVNFFGLFRIKAAIYQPQDDAGTLMITEISLPPGDAPEDMASDLRQALERQGRRRELRIRRSETREFEVRGRTVPFAFAEAVDEQGKEYRQVTGSFASRGGTAILFLQIEEEAWDEQAVVRMIESIR